jgi:hypothetical protein
LHAGAALVFALQSRRGMTKLLCALLLASCADQPATTSTEDDDVQVLDGFFPIAADYQPHTSFHKWKDRGVNTMVRVPPADTVDAWTNEANQLGLKMIREPRNDPHQDKNEPNLLSWHWTDEPELHGVPAGDLESFRQRLRNIDPDIPISVNFWGGGMRLGSCYNGHCYRDYIDHADWVSDDIYPCNKYQCDIQVVGQEVRQLREWSHDHQLAFAYIETSDFDGNGTGPSPRRYAAQVWDAIIHGARGVFYFSERIGGDHHLAQYDATPNDVVDEMKKVDDKLARLAPVLQRGINPKRISVDGPDGLEVTWRYAPDRHAYYVIALNPDDAQKSNRQLRLHGVRGDRAKVFDENRNVMLHGHDTIVDDFAPYEEHVYEVDAGP